MNRLAFPLTLATVLAACGGSAESTPGEETSPCNAGECLGSLVCLSDLCVDPDWEPGATSGPSDGSGESQDSDDPPTPSEPSNEVDILLVVDNSGSMGEEQATLSENIDQFLDPLLAAGMDVRIAITTTDDSNYWCKGAGVSSAESGNFVLSSCRSRLGDFYFSGDDTNAEDACTNFCEFDNINTEPTVTALDPTPRARPWLEATPDGTNLSGTPTLSQALQCAVPQGINGCGFEAPLESMWKALRLAENSSREQYGFLRSTAHLAVVFLSDEVDCSDNSSYENTIFGEEGVGNQAFWSLPDIQQSPSSAVCWNAGVTCSGSDCMATDKDVDGNPTTVADDAALHPVSKYRDLLTNLRNERLPNGAEVFTFGILGVPEDYPSTGNLSYAEGPDGNSPESFQARFGIGPGCTSELGEAVPPVRMRELAEQSPWTTSKQLYSVCNADWGPALGGIANTIVDYTP